MNKIYCAILLVASIFSVQAGNLINGGTVNVSSEKFRVEKIAFFRKGEGCIAGFRRLGHHVSLKTCVQVAKAVGLDIFWSNITDPPLIIPDVKVGQKFSVLSVEGRDSYTIHKLGK